MKRDLPGEELMGFRLKRSAPQALAVLESGGSRTLAKSRRPELFFPDRPAFSGIRKNKIHSVISASRTSGASGRLIFSWRVGLGLVLLFMLVNCAPKKTLYYKPGGDQQKFDLDSKECREWAEAIARSKMADPEAKPDPNLVQKYYEECIHAKGWSKIPLDQRDRSLWKWEGRNLYFETFTLELPSGFSLRTQSKWVFGPTWSHQLQAAGPEKRTFLMIVAQESIENPFEIINYPIPKGYIFYTGGRLDKFDIRWSVFAGRYRQNAIAIFAAYIYLEKTRRISVVFSRALTSTGPAKRDYTLSLSQKKELDELYPNWLSWLKAQTASKEFEEKRGLRRYLRFLWE